MFAGAAVVAIGILLLVFIGCAAHVWLAQRAQVNGTEFRGEIRSRLFTYVTESRPSRGELCRTKNPRWAAGRLPHSAVELPTSRNFDSHRADVAGTPSEQGL
jgi:hypothetical protein